jgi:ankyrin repeat protein
MSADRLLEAICSDDLRAAKKLLDGDKSLATWRAGEARLFEDYIVHWLYEGDTALHLAAAGNRVEVVALLLTAGADANARPNHRASGPLHYAADGCVGRDTFDGARQVETMRLLLKAGAEINAADKNGATPLHRAVRTRSAEAVEFLLSAGADPLLRNKSGSTPFHLAMQNTGKSGSGSEGARTGQRRIIEKFMERGISVKLKDGKRKTVLECASSDWIREMLLN